MLRQTIHQINVDRGKSNTARGLHQGKYLFRRLDTVHSFLHIMVEILHPKAETVKADIPQELQALRINRTGIYFDGVFAILQEAKSLANHPHELAQLVVTHEGRRTPTKVQLRQRLPCSHMLHMQINFSLQILQVLIQILLILWIYRTLQRMLPLLLLLLVLQVLRLEKLVRVRILLALKQG